MAAARRIFCRAFSRQGRNRHQPAFRAVPLLCAVKDPCMSQLSGQARLHDASYPPNKVPKDGSAFVMRSPYEDVDIPEMPLAHYIMDKFDQYGDKVALVDGSSGREWTYDELQSAVCSVGSALARQGYGKGDVVTMFSPNSPEFSVMYLALTYIGVTVSAVNPVYTAAELSQALETSESRAVCTVPALVDTVKRATAKLSSVKETFIFGEGGGFRPLTSLLEDDGSAFPTSIDVDVRNDTANLPYTSGTTGPPKGVMLTHYSLVANIEQLRSSDAFDYHDNDVFIAALPFCHIYGQTVIMSAGLAAGCKIVTMPQFNSSKYLQLAKHHRMTVLHLTPLLTQVLATHPSVPHQPWNVRMAVCGAAPIDMLLARAVCDRLGFTSFRQAFGVTEMSPITHLSPRQGMTYNSIGYPAPNTFCKLVNTETRQPVGINAEGEVLVKGPQMMKGYFQNEAATKRAIRDGWLHTGDVGVIDDNGDLYIHDKVKDLIKYKDIQVSPAELESVLLTHPSIQEAAVIGVPEARGGEVPRAFVILKEGHKAVREEIHEYINELVAPHKRLRGGIEFRQQIPKSDTGKVLKRELKEEFLKSNK